MSAQTISEKFRELKPYIVDLVSGMITAGGVGTVATGGLVAHELNGPYHTGTLSASQFPQFGVHTADASAHHAPVTAGAGIALTGQQVSVDQSYGFVWTGQHYYSPTSPQAPFVLFPDAQGQTVIGFKADQLNKSVTAGNGLSGGGALTANISIALGTPSTLTRTTTNSASGTTHAHAITTSSNPGVAATILASDASGHLTLQKLTLGGSVFVLDSALGSLQMAYGVDTTHYLGRAYIGDSGLGGGGYAAFGHEDVLGSAAYAIAQGGLSDPNTYLNAGSGYNIYHRINNADVMQMNTQRLNPAGTILKDLGDYNRKWRTLFAAELYVETLVAQSVMATIGGRVMVAPTNKLLSDVASGDFTIEVVYNNFQNGTYIYFSSAPGGIAQIEAMKVTSSATTIAGGYRYSVTRNLDGTGANNWVAGDACVSLGEAVGQGYIDLTSTNTIHNHLGPTIAIYTRTATTNWNDVKAVSAFGNLRSFVDYTGDTFGWAVGNDLTLTPSSGFVGLTGDATNGLRLFNVVQKMYNGASLFAQFDATSGLRIMAYTGTSTLPTINGVTWYRDNIGGNKAGYVASVYDSTSSDKGNKMYLTSFDSTAGPAHSFLYAFGETGTEDAYLLVAGGKSSLSKTSGIVGLGHDIVLTTDYTDFRMGATSAGFVYGSRALYFTANGWDNLASSTASEIANDISTFQQLMIVGNTSAGGSRRVGLWDAVQIGGASFNQTLNVNGGIYASGSLVVPGTINAETFALDSSSGSFSLTAGQSLPFSASGAFSGLVMIIEPATGYGAVYFMTGGTVLLVSSSGTWSVNTTTGSNQFDVSYVSSKYQLKNKYATTKTFTIMALRVRNAA